MKSVQMVHNPSQQETLETAICYLRDNVYYAWLAGVVDNQKRR